MAVGDVVLRGTVVHPVAVPNYMSAKDAMVQALGAYLLAQEFIVYGGADIRDTVLRLREFRPEWPKAEEKLVYPCASAIEVAGTEHMAHSLTPTPLEDTWGTFDHLIGLAQSQGATVLWQEGEASCQLQVDFWLDNDPDREAIDGQLPAIFSPGEGRYGVIVEGPELYYSRDVRLTLLTTTRDDSGLSSYRHERRLRCLVQAECDIVSLRRATATVTPQNAIEVTDPNDPPEDDEEG